MKDVSKYIKIVDEERTLSSIQQAIIQAQTDIDVKQAIYDFCDILAFHFDESLYKSWVDDLDDWFENVYNKPKNIVEETIPITLGLIRNKCGWSDFCDVTGANHYMLNEFTVSDREIFDVKISHAKILNLI